MSDLETIFGAVRPCIADSLALAQDEVTLDSRLLDDLGADSLDLVDIVFTLERKFRINVRETEFNFLTRLDFSSPEVMQNGYLTADVIERLTPWLSGLAHVADRGKVTPRELFSQITVASICAIVSRHSAPGAGVSRP